MRRVDTQGMQVVSAAGPAIQRADPRARRRARWLLALALPLVPAAALGSELLRAWLEELARENPADAVAPLRITIWVVSAATVLPLLGFAAWMWRFSGRIAAARRFPPPGVAMVHDTRVLEGRAAVIYAGLGRALALCLAGCALVLAWIARLALACLERGAGA